MFGNINVVNAVYGTLHFNSFTSSDHLVMNYQTVSQRDVFKGFNYLLLRDSQHYSAPSTSKSGRINVFLLNAVLTIKCF